MTEQTSKSRQGEERSKELENQLDEVRAAAEDARAKITKVSLRVTCSTTCVSRANKKHQAESALTEATAAREGTQSELDDLLLVFGDLEEKAARYKVRESVTASVHSHC